uniref:CSON015388 protein n=1 Tax=Culicoides sonorensis TaxID=179676 RepID=A0A336MIS2_CULSO
MTWPLTEWTWGPFWLPGLYDVDTNWPSIKFVLISSIFFFFRFRSGAPPRIFYSKKRLDGKVAIVTGSNSGIGKETVRDLARRGCRVIMACRNMKEAHKVKDEIVEATHNKEIFVFKLDLSSFKSVRQFSEDFMSAESRLDILIHNAGYGNAFDKQVSVDGIEMTMATNHYGPFLLTHLLMPILKKTQNPRIVVVASDLYKFAKINLKNLNPKNGIPLYLYYVSKNANIMFTLELAKRLEGTGITANCLHPGMVDTGIWKNTPFPLTYPMAFLRKFFKTPFEGAQNTLSVALSDDIEGETGKYFVEMRPEKLQEKVMNEENNRILWEQSVKMKRLDGKVAIVTGSNSGIGKETVKDLARRGCRVIMACRNMKETHKVKDEIVESTHNKEIFVFKLDLSSFKSVRQFSEDFMSAESRLDILIHNAGYGNAFDKQVSVDGIEMTMATNHYGPFLLTHLLMPILKKTQNPRIVVVASDLYKFAKLNLKNLNPKNGIPLYLYYVSKNANIMFTLELAKRLEGTGITANCLHPGMVDTGIWKNTPFPLTYPMAFLRKFFKTPFEGAQNTLSVALSDDIEGETGKYFVEMRPEKLQEKVMNEENNTILWEQSVKMMLITLFGYQLPWHDNNDSYTGTKIVALFVLFLYLRYYSASKVRMFFTKRRMEGKTVIVTGANSGIGKETAKYLASLGARVILACRNMDAASKAKDEIIRDSKNSNVVVRKLDVSSMKSVREFASEINRSEQRLDVLIHNAGYANTFTKLLSRDGIEMTMATNHYGPFLLTHLLIDLLKKTENSRIVVVSSYLYKLARLNLNKLNPIGTLPAYLYYVSKNANIMFTRELAKRLQGTGVTANCVHPGLVDSGIWRNVPFPLNIPLKFIIFCFFKTPWQGCQTTVFCAVSEQLEGVSGKYYEYNRETKLEDYVTDEEKNAKFWEASAKLVNDWYIPFFRDDQVHVYGKIFSIIVFFLVTRYLSAIKVRYFYPKRRMDGKTVIITGANGGIGKETAKFLAKLGARVIMACRNLDAANSVRDEIIKETQNPNVIVKKLDLSSFRSVREFASEINRSEERLDVLLHNAGYANTFKKEVSEDGIEMTMATNHYGPFLLTHLLIDLLKKTDNSRIVVVASYLYKLARLNLNNLNPIGTLPGYLYYVSKNANIMFTRELSKRLEGTGVTANCLHPGLVDTGIWRNVPFPMNLPLKLINYLYFKTPVQGCQTSVFCAVSEELDGVSGCYYEYNRETKLENYVTDEKKNATFWDASVKLVKLTDSDPKI